MPFSIVSLESVTVIALGGDLDVFTIERLRPELLGLVRRRPACVEVDLSRLRSISPRGMRELAFFFAELSRISCRVTVTGIRDEPARCSQATLLDVILSASPPLN